MYLRIFSMAWFSFFSTLWANIDSCQEATVENKIISTSPPIVVTVPKSGSHLIKHIVSLIENKAYINVSTFFGYGPGKFNAYLDSEFHPETRFIMFHTEEMPEIELYLRKYPNTKVLLAVRNLKDLVVSAKDYFTLYGPAFPYFDEYIFQFHSIPMGEWQALDNKQRLIDTIKYFFLFQEKNLHRANLSHFVRDAIWIVERYPNTKVIRFEDFFVDHNSLLKQIRSIGEFLGKSLSQEELEWIATRSIGNPFSHTYTDKKKLHRYMDEFDDELLELFNDCFGDLEALYDRTFYSDNTLPVNSLFNTSGAAKK